ncbi:MAG: OmpA family protein [Bacteroidia bacterium]|nr:OmpA family protein [Bacteroidia bacterium]MDW8301747.1 OmpA family protein [Bacteroidia bacterium]
MPKWIVYICFFCGIVQGLTQEEKEIITVTTLAGTTKVGHKDGDCKQALFYGPNRLYISNSGNIYITDEQNYCVRRINVIGNVSTLVRWKDFDKQILAQIVTYRPAGLYVDFYENVFVTEPSKHRLMHFQPKKAHRIIAGKTDTPGFVDGVGENALLHTPTGMCVDEEGNFYIVEQWNNAVRKVTQKGEVTTIAGGKRIGFADGKGLEAQFNNPTGICIDKNRNLYVADCFNHRIRKIAPDGTVTTVAGNGLAGYKDGKAEEALFNYPYELCVDSENNIYVVEEGNHTVRKIDYRGIVSTIAGNGSPGYKDGIGKEAQFNTPHDVEMDSKGNLYVADYKNNCIRKITFSKLKPESTPTVQPSFLSKTISVKFSAKITDKLTYLPVDAQIIIEDSTHAPIRLVANNGLVTETITLEPGTYKLTVQHQDYLLRKQYITFSKEDKEKNLFIDLEKLYVGKIITFNNINFNPNEATFLPESYPDLNEIYLFLKNNPTVQIQINGHTDNGAPGTNPQYLLELSQKRAQAVANYLIQLGISPHRVKYKGFGNTRPIADNSTPEGRRQNRRTEVEIIAGQ